MLFSLGDGERHSEQGQIVGGRGKQKAKGALNVETAAASVDSEALIW